MSTPSTPNDELASLVARLLVAQGHVPSDKRDELLAKLKSGSITAEDWKLYVEIALKKAESEVSDGTAD
jgi:hypothetical protein